MSIGCGFGYGSGYAVHVPVDISRLPPDEIIIIKLRFM
jgi:hypothetical protein